ncbi:hypothetical protein PIB30_068251 [Stylosanthes scabra]|uniref:Uncharacterized protein n=1 Tax=Stylosanthes scabra TaxID=79078 RepID=A0ABU6UQP3_9FABA|nr:hypothetical protein [Stylosanthes scabra]
MKNEDEEAEEASKGRDKAVDESVVPAPAERRVVACTDQGATVDAASVWPATARRWMDWKMLPAAVDVNEWRWMMLFLSSLRHERMEARVCEFTPQDDVALEKDVDDPVIGQEEALMDELTLRDFPENRTPQSEKSLGEPPIVQEEKLLEDLLSKSTPKDDVPSDKEVKEQLAKAILMVAE